MEKTKRKEKQRVKTLCFCYVMTKQEINRFVKNRQKQDHNFVYYYYCNLTTSMV